MSSLPLCPSQMDAKNLSLCFSPSLFSLSSCLSSKHYSSPSNPFSRMSSLKRHTLNTTTSPLTLSSTKEVTETVVCDTEQASLLCIRSLARRLWNREGGWIEDIFFINHGCSLPVSLLQTSSQSLQLMIIHRKDIFHVCTHTH